MWDIVELLLYKTIFLNVRKYHPLSSFFFNSFLLCPAYQYKPRGEKVSRVPLDNDNKLALDKCR